MVDPFTDTGGDVRWIALSLKAPRARRAVLGAVKALGPDAKLCLDRAGKGRDWLLDVAGFAGEIDIAALGEALGAEVRVLGSYAAPLPATALANESNH